MSVASREEGSLSLEPIEVETIGLYIVVRAIDDFVNRALLHIPGGPGLPTFAGSVARDLFVVRLLDFLEPVDAKMTGVDGSCVDLLEMAVATSSFDRDSSVEGLRTAVLALRTWLSERITIRVWLPTLDLDAEISLTRHDVVHVAGNTSKHNLSRLSRVAGRLRRILKENSHEIGIEDSWLAVEDFEQKFKDDLLAYYCVRITGLLNDVRWAVHDYLIPEYRESYTLDPDRPPMYSYRFPAGLNSRFSRESYWGLMNKVRSEPYIARFVVPDHMMEHPFLVPDATAGSSAAETG